MAYKGFFEQPLTVTADSELVGTTCRIYQTEITGKKSSNYQLKDITGTTMTDWYSRLLGSFTITDNKDDGASPYGEFSVSKFNEIPTIHLKKYPEKLYIINNGASTEYFTGTQSVYWGSGTTTKTLHATFSSNKYCVLSGNGSWDGLYTDLDLPKGLYSKIVIEGLSQNKVSLTALNYKENSMKSGLVSVFSVSEDREGLSNGTYSFDRWENWDHIRLLWFGGSSGTYSSAQVKNIYLTN